MKLTIAEMEANLDLNYHVFWYRYVIQSLNRVCSPLRWDEDFTIRGVLSVRNAEVEVTIGRSCRANKGWLFALVVHRMLKPSAHSTRNVSLWTVHLTQTPSLTLLFQGSMLLV